jgi:hypothetical protein
MDLRLSNCTVAQYLYGAQDAGKPRFCWIISMLYRIGKLFRRSASRNLRSVATHATDAVAQPDLDFKV